MLAAALADPKYRWKYFTGVVTRAAAKQAQETADNITIMALITYPGGMVPYQCAGGHCVQMATMNALQILECRVPESQYEKLMALGPRCGLSQAVNWLNGLRHRTVTFKKRSVPAAVLNSQGDRAYPRVTDEWLSTLEVGVYVVRSNNHCVVFHCQEKGHEGVRMLLESDNTLFNNAVPLSAAHLRLLGHSSVEEMYEMIVMH